MMGSYTEAIDPIEVQEYTNFLLPAALQTTSEHQISLDGKKVGTGQVWSSVGTVGWRNETG